MTTPEDRAFAAAWKIVSAWDGKITKPVLRKAIDAAIAEALDGKWMDIETAPKDGTRFLAAEYDDGWMIGVCQWCKTSHVPLYGFHFMEGDPEDLNIANPTHWMPLPSAPVSNGGEHG
ncbi:DUF551 domain-containing protein [Rhizobium lentis]|uniref:DUF551 domain-containing protein n=1 Tax=Rhizobium lentis TaxID=1138194 RepID=A0ABS7IBY0_9HYPH|nr:DUF551 domain-containing protein [Rhizobium lentis]MBX5089397.1 DUF551 domain-containing protein [Rhizobium lentis]